MPTSPLYCSQLGLGLGYAYHCQLLILYIHILYIQRINNPFQSLCPLYHIFSLYLICLVMNILVANSLNIILHYNCLWVTLFIH